MIRAAAARWGRFLGRYGRRLVNERSVRFTSLPVLPPAPTIFVCWHEHNLIAIALYRLLRTGPVFTFVPKGIRGAAMTAWVSASGARALPLPGDASDGIQLRRMSEALRNGSDVMIAVDGPSGPRGRVRPGALWLAEAADAPVVAFGFAAEPAFRLPRWDRHLVPLPGARIAVAFSDPMIVRPEGRDALGECLSRALAETTTRAASGLRSEARPVDGTPLQPRSAHLWK